MKGPKIRIQAYNCVRTNGCVNRSSNLFGCEVAQICKQASKSNPAVFRWSWQGHAESSLCRADVIYRHEVTIEEGVKEQKKMPRESQWPRITVTYFMRIDFFPELFKFIFILLNLPIRKKKQHTKLLSSARLMTARWSAYFFHDSAIPIFAYPFAHNQEFIILAGQWTCLIKLSNSSTQCSVIKFNSV